MRRPTMPEQGTTGLDVTSTKNTADAWSIVWHLIGHALRSNQVVLAPTGAQGRLLSTHGGDHPVHLAERQRLRR